MDIKKQINDVLSKYPDLKFLEDKNVFVGVLDGYELRIELTPYPKRFPTVFEVGERIPKKADRHIYEDTGNCCFTTSALSQILLKTKIKSLESFIKNIILPYLENNSYYELNQHYYTQEYSHGMDGVLEGFKDILDVNHTYKVLRIVLDVCQGKFIKSSDKCYCGSNKSLKTCSNGKHYRKYNNLRSVDVATLRYDLVKLIDHIKKT